jgi:hypothetical protein
MSGEIRTLLERFFVGDDELQVTPNLHAALVQLRDYTFPRILWIDAICINHADDDEKSLQIRSMTMIYGMVRCVLVWLGEAADGSDNALKWIRAMASDSLKCPEASEADDIDQRLLSIDYDTPKNVTSQDVESLTDVASLLQREWFERIWVRPRRLSTYAKVLKDLIGPSRSSRCCANCDRTW